MGAGDITIYSTVRGGKGGQCNLCRGFYNRNQDIEHFIYISVAKPQNKTCIHKYKLDQTVESKADTANLIGC